ncbi:MAG TPA: ABC-2 family transporter protein [Ktedonobacteraceae bacterium]
MPYALIASFPTSALTGRASPLLLSLIGLAVALLAFAQTQLVWHAGLRHYTSASS